MTKHPLVLCFLASPLLLSGAQAQGLLGERYLGLGVAYEDISNGDTSLDGWGVAAEVNIPQAEPTTPFSFDTNVGVHFLRYDGDGFDFEEFALEGVLRGYRRLGHGFSPFVGAGIGWWRWEVSDDFGFGRDSFFTLPMEIGFEYAIGSFSITPFYRYTWVLESRPQDFWSAGATAAFWFHRDWAVAATVTYNDWRGGTESIKGVAGLLMSY